MVLGECEYAFDCLALAMLTLVVLSTRSRANPARQGTDPNYY